jgi:hypothetical protein
VDVLITAQLSGERIDDVVKADDVARTPCHAVLGV